MYAQSASGRYKQTSDASERRDMLSGSSFQWCIKCRSYYVSHRFWANQNKMDLKKQALTTPSVKLKCSEVKAETKRAAHYQLNCLTTVGQSCHCFVLGPHALFGAARKRRILYDRNSLCSLYVFPSRQCLHLRPYVLACLLFRVGACFAYVAAVAHRCPPVLSLA